MRQDEAQRTGALAGASVVVTGAGRGIGEALVTAFAERGARVVVADLDGERAGAVAAALRGAGRDATAVTADVTSPAEVDGLFEQVASRSGRLDVLVNNAGVVHVTEFDDLSTELWRHVFAVNVEGPLLTMQRAGRVMRGQAPHPATGCRGKILNVSSGAAEHGRPFLAAYGASKAALNHLSATAAVVFADAAVATTVLYPGNVREGMWDDLGRRLAGAEGRSVEEVEAGRRFQPAAEFALVAVDVAATPGMALNGAIVDATGEEVVVR